MPKTKTYWILALSSNDAASMLTIRYESLHMDGRENCFFFFNFVCLFFSVLRIFFYFFFSLNFVSFFLCHLTIKRNFRLQNRRSSYSIYCVHCTVTMSFAAYTYLSHCTSSFCSFIIHFHSLSLHYSQPFTFNRLCTLCSMAWFMFLLYQLFFSDTSWFFEKYFH